MGLKEAVSGLSWLLYLPGGGLSAALAPAVPRPFRPATLLLPYLRARCAKHVYAVRCASPEQGARPRP